MKLIEGYCFVVLFKRCICFEVVFESMVFYWGRMRVFLWIIGGGGFSCDGGVERGRVWISVLVRGGKSLGVWVCRKDWLF